MSYQPKNFTLPTDNTATKGIDPYVFNDQIAIAVDVALATGRPLLVAGSPGCGKSRLAEAMASLLEWNYLSHTLTSRTRLEELTGEIDHLQRLHDANAARSPGSDGNNSNNVEMKPDWAYLKPGVFWWAFDAESAANRGGDEKEAKKREVTLNYPGIQKHAIKIDDKKTDDKKTTKNTVLLLDEIDKAEPDLPNDLLEPLEGKTFSVTNGKVIEAPKKLKILTIITTNRERALPQAFLRRCVTLNIEEPKLDKRIEIGKKHYSDVDVALLTKLAEQIDQIAKTVKSGKKPGTSEYLDAIAACKNLRLKVDSKKWNETWPLIEQAVMIKNIENH